MQQENTAVATEVEVAEEETNSVFFIAKEGNYYNADYHNGWKVSPSELLQGTIDGRGDSMEEEGVAVFVVKNNETNSSTVYELGNNEPAQKTPKAFEWIDDERVYIIIGYPYGTVTKGGDLYIFNLKDNTITPVFQDSKGSVEVTSITKEIDGFLYVKQGYITPPSK